MNARLLASTFCVLLLCAIASFVSAQEVNVGTNNNHGHRYGGGDDDGNGHSGDHGGHPKPTPKPGLDGETDWNNTGTDFNTASNWTSVTGAIPPGAGDVAWFKVAKSTDPNLSASVSIAGLYFSSTASSGYTLSATSPFALTLTGYATDTSGTEDSNASAVAIGANNTSGTNTISAPIILAPATGSTSTFYQAGGATLVVSGVISGSGKGLMKTGAGTVSLTGANTYTGGTTVTGGVLQLGVNSAESGGVIATGPVGTGTLTLGTGTTLRSASANTRALQNNISLSGAITLGGTTPNNGTLVFNSSNLTTPATVSLTADTTLMLNSAVFINNVITGSGINLSKSGDILILGAANTFSGGFTANSGTTRLDVNNALG